METVGEGTGFGVPALLYSNETYFSGTSQVYLSQQGDFKTLRKEFFMNKVPRKKIGKVRLESRKLRAMLRHLAEGYQKHRRFRVLTLTDLSKRIGVQTNFVNTDSAGKVTVTYVMDQEHIMVKIDFSLLKRENLQKIFVLNEQGSRFYRRYNDSNGTKLVDKEIGAWETVKTEWASITDLQGRVGFRLWKKENAILRRGREFLKDCRDWIGLDYEINPHMATFEYEIEILGANQ